MRRSLLSGAATGALGASLLLLLPAPAAGQAPAHACDHDHQRAPAPRPPLQQRVAEETQFFVSHVLTPDRGCLYIPHNLDPTRLDPELRATRDSLQRLVEAPRPDAVRIGENRARGVAFDIVYDVDPAIVNIPGFVPMLEKAAFYWESKILDPVTILIRVEAAPDDPEIQFLAAASSSVWQWTFANIANLLRANAIGGPEAELVNALPSTTLPAWTDAGVVFLENALYTSANRRAIRPELPPPAPDEPDALVVFNFPDFTYDFNPADGLPSCHFDSLSTSIHEIGHVLGFVSTTEFVVEFPFAYTLDFFRFGWPGELNDPISIATMANTLRELRVGVDATIDAPGLALDNLQPPLSTGVNGDGRQSSHWKDDVLLGARPELGIMDPSSSLSDPFDALNPGYISIWDDLALTLIGWELRTPCISDFDANRVVNGVDLAMLINSWQTRDPTVNLDTSTRVDSGDLTELLAAWGPCD